MCNPGSATSHRLAARIASRKDSRGGCEPKGREAHDKNEERAVGALVAASTSVVSAKDAEHALLERARQRFKPLPPDASTPERPLTPERVGLGKALFFEPRVSSDLDVLAEPEIIERGPESSPHPVTSNDFRIRLYAEAGSLRHRERTLVR
jgi:hypothetical protein